MHFVPELRSPEGLSSLSEAPRTPPYPQAASLDRPLRLCSQSWWPPPKRAAPQATVPAGPANGARLQPRGTGSSAESGTRAVASGAPPAPGLRLQVHTRSPAGAPSRSPAPPPGYSSPFIPPPGAAAAAAAAAVAAAVAVRPDWLAAGAPALSHGPRRVRLTGGAAGAALAHGQANRGARGGAGR